MSAKDQQGTTGEPSGSGGAQPDPSRRAVLRGVAGAGLAGVAASALISLPASQARASTTRAAGRPASAGGAEPPAGGAEPSSDVVVHLRDVRSGEMDIFSGTSQTRLRDPDLARQLVRAIR